MLSKKLGLLLAGLALCSAAGVSAQSFEMPVQCLANGATAPAVSTFTPVVSGITVNADGTSRYVGMAVQWDAARGGVGILGNGYGLELKTYQYNYDDAAATGKGPAYVMGPASYNYCDLPGCYVDSDLLSKKNSLNEYSEPQVGFGIIPGSAASIQTARTYVAWTRATSGRGAKSLLKARQYATTKVLNGMLGIYSYFLCQDLPVRNVIAFQEGVSSPTCVVRTAAGTLAPCVAEIVPPPPGCTSQVTAAGGASGANLTKDFGGSSGTVTVEFEAFGVPDALKITQVQSGASLLSTGFVKGYNKRTFPFDWGAGSTVRIEVEGNKAEPTAWDLRVSCPGKQLDAPLPRKNVYFRVKDNTCGAVWTYGVDGAPLAALASASLTVGSQHFVTASWQLQNPTSQCGAGGYPGTLWVDDGRGEIAVIGAYGPYSGYFDVRP